MFECIFPGATQWSEVHRSNFSSFSFSSHTAPHTRPQREAGRGDFFPSFTEWLSPVISLSSGNHKPHTEHLQSPPHGPEWQGRAKSRHHHQKDRQEEGRKEETHDGMCKLCTGSPFFSNFATPDAPPGGGIGVVRVGLHSTNSIFPMPAPHTPPHPHPWREAVTRNSMSRMTLRACTDFPKKGSIEAPSELKHHFISRHPSTRRLRPPNLILPFTSKRSTHDPLCGY